MGDFLRWGRSFFLIFKLGRVRTHNALGLIKLIEVQLKNAIE